MATGTINKKGHKMENKEVVIDGVTYVPKGSRIADPVDGMNYCIVRCRDAGVHAGFVKERAGREVTLIQSRRLWRWHGKTLSGLATEGTTDANQCKYANEIPEITVLDACEIIPCTHEGMVSIRDGVEPWENE